MTTVSRKYANEMHCDLMRQGFMKPWKPKRAQKSGAEIAAQLTKETGVRIEYLYGRYRVPHPAGHDNYLATAAEARSVAKNQRKA